jgi:pimeloyl-ACP methyl ester carboxylesterase
MNLGLPAAAAWLALSSCLPSHQAIAACTPSRVDVGGYHLWIRVAGRGRPTVIFESGNGEDSSVWGGIEPRVRALGVTTVIYDRSGLGKSDLKPGPYDIDDDVRALDRALAACRIRGPRILVAHSYGGNISGLVAHEDKDVKGLVYVDAGIPSFLDDAEVARMLTEYRPQYDELRIKSPKLARVLIPIMEAFPDTARRVQEQPVPADIPIIDIVAEHSWVSTPAEEALWRKAHAEFVAASPAREAIFAAGSNHHVMHDKPALVLGAITRMIDKVRSVSTSSRHEQKHDASENEK